ncbi:MAG: hypothetical protein JO159_05565 [Acidobacteria bacterium]|nr:hypothetical protein [Acidobacteriota bacterium]
MPSSREISAARPTVLIVTDEDEFSRLLTSRWLREGGVPSFTVRGSSSPTQLAAESFDLAIAGGIADAALGAIASCLQPLGRPIVYVCRPGACLRTNTVSLPEVAGWPDLAVTVAAAILECAHARAEAGRLRQLNFRLEQFASLGRYLVDMRHNLNNALTSILGNSDLILLEQACLPPVVRTQVETIRNMGLRMNEIMQRFSSLQKELQLVEEQSAKEPASKGAACSP